MPEPGSIYDPPIGVVPRFQQKKRAPRKVFEKNENPLTFTREEALETVHLARRQDWGWG